MNLETTNTPKTEKRPGVKNVSKETKTTLSGQDALYVVLGLELDNPVISFVGENAIEITGAKLDG